MADFRISINLDNAAFCDDEGKPSHGQEVARLLKTLAERIQNVEDLKRTDGSIHDHNGNRCGDWAVLGH